MSDVRSRNKAILATHTQRGKITKVSRNCISELRPKHWKMLTNTVIVPNVQRKAYFLGRANTRADTAEFFNVPPITNGPRGVKTIPRESARTSYVSSVIVSHRLPCNSNTNVTGDSSACLPSLSRPLKLCGAVVPPEKSTR